MITYVGMYIHMLGYMRVIIYHCTILQTNVECRMRILNWLRKRTSFDWRVSRAKKFTVERLSVKCCLWTCEAWETIAVQMGMVGMQIMSI